MLCPHAECHILYIVMLSVVMLSVVMLSVVAPLRSLHSLFCTHVLKNIIRLGQKLYTVTSL
jgi:hypothetical protein